MASWTRGDKLMAAGVIVAILGVIASLFVTEVRQWLGLETAKPAPVVTSSGKPGLETAKLTPGPRKPETTPHRRVESTTQPNSLNHAPSGSYYGVQDGSSSNDLSGLWSATYPGGP
jgi:hypothetical protein